jgi:fructosamine-3-kinase
MGSLVQYNTPEKSWVEFFVCRRLQVQVALAFDSGHLDKSAVTRFDRFYSRLDQIFSPGKPSLLHGDLWGGNYMVSESGEPCLIDPAVYYGHREVDLAMTTLFGGFSAEFYTGYESHHKLEPGWRERLDIYNLYPLLVHLNLFGSSYLGSVTSILKRFS